MPTKLLSHAAIVHYLLGDTMGWSLRDLENIEPGQLIAFVSQEARINKQAERMEAYLAEGMLETWMAHQEAMHQYAFGSYSGRLLYFRARDSSPHHPEQMHLPWLELGVDVDVRVIQGDHLTMNEPPNVAQMAQIITRGIHAALR